MVGGRGYNDCHDFSDKHLLLLPSMSNRGHQFHCRSYCSHRCNRAQPPSSRSRSDVDGPFRMPVRNLWGSSRKFSEGSCLLPLGLCGLGFSSAYFGSVRLRFAIKYCFVSK